MKVAARFPVKAAPIVLYFIILLHIIIGYCAFLLLGLGWQLALSCGLLSVTFLISYRQHLQLTSAPDDLCWSGENWLITDPSQSKEVIYLELLPQSWLTSFACILHFNDGQKQRQWLFIRPQLGDRSFSELCYWAKLTLRQQTKEKIQS